VESEKLLHFFLDILSEMDNIFSRGIAIVEQDESVLRRNACISCSISFQSGQFDQLSGR
jgi:hypothetical protein